MIFLSPVTDIVFHERRQMSLILRDHVAVLKASNKQYIRGLIVLFN